MHDKMCLMNPSRQLGRKRSVNDLGEPMATLRPALFQHAALRGWIALLMAAGVQRHCLRQLPETKRVRYSNRYGRCIAARMQRIHKQ
jgi:hypothetical protein